MRSLLATLRLKQWIERKVQAAARTYRLAYNLLALMLLVPILMLARAHPGPLLWQWHGAARWLGYTLMLIALAGFIIASRDYDIAAFLGLPRLRSPAAAISEPPFRIGRVHRYVRHPWYSCGLIPVWTQPMTASWLVSSVVITLYVLLGARLEEAKLIALYGEAYRRYRARIPAFVPLPGRSLSAAEAAALERLQD